MRKYFAMFEFYYHYFKGSAKKYDIAMDSNLNHIATITPLVCLIIHIFTTFFAFNPFLVISMFIWIPVIFFNLTAVDSVRREGYEILWAQEDAKREAEREARQREYDRIMREKQKYQEEQRRQREEEFNKAWEDMFRGFHEKYNRQNSHQQSSQQRYTSTSKLDTALKFLGLTKSATKDDVKKAYRKLAKVHHPDMGGNEKDFIKLKEHYDYAMNQL